LRRWRDFAARPHVIGYTARTDRYGETRLIDHAEEINLLALARGAEDRNVTAEQIYDEFLASRYGLRGDAPESAVASAHVKAAFKRAFEIATSSLYTLGSVSANHSSLDFDPYASNYVLQVSGKWYDPPIGYVAHGVNREFHYWRDVIDHLAPAFVKDPAYKQAENFVPTEDERKYIHPGEAMNEEYLRYIVTEKNYGVALAEDSVRHIEKARAALTPAAYEDLHAYFERTLLTARLHRAAASAYFGFRVWCRGKDFQTGYVHDTVQKGLAEIQEVVPLIRNYPVKPPAAAYTWVSDADSAEHYFHQIVDGWPRVTQQDIVNPNAGMKFPTTEP
ncbi:MAG TPA: hypothetical protein VFB27_01850, partial [Opitutaceae bacterium]|nr:hypothetical protein [Opitutaceae bacterium]